MGHHLPRPLAHRDRRALQDRDLLARVREHKKAIFSRAWEKLDEATPGTLRLVPQDDIKPILAADYAAMSGMMFGEAPTFDWVLQELAKLEETINAVKVA